MFISFIRTIIIYFFTIFSLRMLGKRQIGELEPSELVVTIIISEVAATPIQNLAQPLLPSLIPIALLLILEVILSFSAYKSPKIRKLFYGTPSIFYEKGTINQKEMEKQRFNLNDLMETVRNTGATSLSDIEYIIMETNGNVSVISKPEKSAVTPEDLNLKNASPVFISYVIIDNGKVNKNNLHRLGFNDYWLKKQLGAKKIKNPERVFCMTASQSGDVVIIPKQQRKDSSKK